MILENATRLQYVSIKEQVYDIREKKPYESGAISGHAYVIDDQAYIVRARMGCECSSCGCKPATYYVLRPEFLKAPHFVSRHDFDHYLTTRG